MNIFKFLRYSSQKKEEKRKSNHGSLSDFFLHASEKEKEDVITKAAMQANEEQRKVFEESQVALKR